MDFKGFPKIPRLSRDCVITEKIDGTNGCIAIGEDGSFQVGSKNRWLFTNKGQDNFGFARWAMEHKDELLTLGPGVHYGEWWGNGIQRGYGLKNGDRRFSLFNVFIEKRPCCVSTVPLLYSGPFTTEAVELALTSLGASGSTAAPGYSNPEGVVIYHIASGYLFKKTLLDDARPKDNWLQYHQKERVWKIGHGLRMYRNSLTTLEKGSK